MPEFVHLHVHSEYSLLDGACRIKRLVSRAKEMGMSAVAVTDHGNVYAAVEFFDECKAQGIKPIIGCEMYVAEDSRFERAGRPYHLILLCKNEQGYKNLCKLSSASFTEGFYYKPRIDFKLLRQHSEGLVCLSACLAGEIARKLSDGNYDGAKETALRYQAVFGDDYYIEVQNHDLQEQRQILPYQYKLARELGIKCVATNDCHYIDKSDARMQKILMCVSTNTRENDPDAMDLGSEEFYFKSPEEMEMIFAGHLDTIANTVEIANKCNFEFEFGKTKLPGFSVDGVTDNEQYLKDLCRKGLRDRYGDNPPADASERLEYELSVIAKMGFVNYYLIVWDFISYAKSQDIPVGPGRGSGAGSLAAYCIGITDVDPLKYNLLFERFLNPERVSMPDFDIDFCYVRRQEVIDYVKRRYGTERVAQIVTFDTLAARSAINDVARAMGVTSASDRLSAAVPRGMSIQQAIDGVKEFRELYLGNAQNHEIIDMAKCIEGMPRHISTHAAGVVITEGPVSDHVPLQANDGQIITQYTMTVLERLGLLKIDFLGLRNLTIINDTVKNIKKSDPGFDIGKIPYDDPKVYEMFARGDTVGIFQFESDGMTNVVMRLVPQSIEDLTAALSLYRPGPMDSIPTYIRNRHNPKLIKYRTPLLKPILDVTYGCIVYQEQVMQIFRELAGYSYGRADVVRRAMAKKKHKELEAERKAFIYGDETTVGCLKNGISEQDASELFDEMLSFASYAFNKSHAASYATVAYQTAYLKLYHFREYMAALLTSVLGWTSKIIEYTEACEQGGVKILGPDVNLSDEGFTVCDGGIRYGLLAVKNLGSGVIDNLKRERETNGNFTSLYDFISRLYGRELNSKALEALIKAGAFDSFPHNRREMMQNFDRLMSAVSGTKRDNLEGQFDLFGDFEDASEPEIPPAEEYRMSELLEYEKEILGIYISGHPLSEYTQWAQAADIHTARRISDGVEADEREFANRRDVSLIGIVRKVTLHQAKNGQDMCFATLEDVTGEIEIVVFPNLFAVSRKLLTNGSKLYVKGKISIRDEEKFSILADELIPIDQKIDELSKMAVRVRFSSTDAEKKDALRQLCAENPGGNQVQIYLSDMSAVRMMKGAQSISLTGKTLSELIKIFGQQNVKLRDIVK